MLSASRDWVCNLWDLATTRCFYKVRLDAPIWMAEISPESPFTFCASLLDSPAVLVQCLPCGDIRKKQLLDDLESKQKNQAVLCSIFTPNGDFVLGGTSKGQLLMWSIEGDLVRSWKLTSGSIKGMSLSSTAPPYVVTNSTDRIIRTVVLPSKDDPELETEHKFQDIVNRLQWHSSCFSGNAEYIAASTYHSANDVYIWERQRGSLVKILEGPKEELVDIGWHPSLVMVAGVGVESGAVYLWGVRPVEKWGNFAPDFKELEENVEYQEQEDEFDIMPEEETGERKLLDETLEIDLEGMGGGEDDFGFVLPVDLEFSADGDATHKSQANITPIDFDF